MAYTFEPTTYQFRAWRKSTKTMIYPSDGQTIMDFFTQFLGSADDVIFMSAIGVNSIDGELIHEGDILDIDEYPFHDQDEHNYVAVVECYPPNFYTVMKKISENVVGASHNVSEILEADNCQDIYKIIGNVFENPEIIKWA
jgi:uncharacterized phage protein (TIGR01671 family)